MDMYNFYGLLLICNTVKVLLQAEELNTLLGDAFRMAFASQLQPSAPLWVSHHCLILFVKDGFDFRKNKFKNRTLDLSIILILINAYRKASFNSDNRYDFYVHTLIYSLFV